jgi:hypothetical protein
MILGEKSEAKHWFCIWHIVDNLYNTFSSHDINEKLKAAMYEKKIRKFEVTMNDLKDINEHAWLYVMDIRKSSKRMVEKKSWNILICGLSVTMAIQTIGDHYNERTRVSH